MLPILFTWKGRIVSSYKVMVLLGVITVYLIMLSGAVEEHLPVVPTMIVTATAIVSAVVGARLYHILLHRSWYFSHPRLVWSRSDGGASAYGAAMASFLVGTLLLLVFGLPAGRVGDLAAIAILPGFILCRIGCLLHGCCLGRVIPSPIGLPLGGGPEPRVRRFPVVHFEIALAFLLLLVALVSQGRGLAHGMALLFVCSGYVLGRFFLDFLREEKTRKGKLAPSQWTALALCLPITCAGIFLIV